MSGVSWQEVETILAAVIELPKDARAARVDQLCGDRVELRAEVESLLAAHEEAAGFMAVDTQIRLEPASNISLVGKRLGPYCLLEVVGAGGMGAVYRAERTDGRFQKQVAIKVVPAAIHFPELLRRFHSEQQILASLEHANIARLLDAGVSPDGVSYFVMEFVEGVRIDQYCNAQRLATRERLRLFRSICDAVQYAHQHLVVHRDLKPANILVGGDGVPKLLDFGVAKILDPWRGELSEAAHSLLNPMTPGYASPEQVRGAKLTTASDIYSLGTVLYELLTEQPAQAVAGKSLDEAIRIVCETEPVRPSSVRGKVGAARLELSSDLDAIVGKAMRKDPQQRYASAQEFSTDISRHLQGLPVLAHQGSLRYVARKFVARHRAGMLAVVVAILLIVGGVAAVVWQGRIAERERARAQRRFDDVRSLARSLMFEVHDSIKDLPGATPARKLLVSRASQYLDSLSRESAGDAELQRELAAAYERLGDVQGNPEWANLGETTAALASYGKGAKLRESLLQADPANAARKLELSGTYFKIGACYDANGDLSDALSNYEKARAEAEESGIDRQDPALVDALAAAYWGISHVLRQQGDLPRSLEGYRAAVALREGARVTSDAQKAEFRIREAGGYRDIAEVLRQQKQYGEAVLAAAGALAALQAAADADPNNSTLRQWAAAGHDELGLCLEDAGHLNESLDNFQKAREIFRSSMIKDPTDTNAARLTGFMDLEVGRVMVKSGNAVEALNVLREALQTFERLAKASPETASLTDNFANVYSGLGVAHAALGADTTLPGEARREHWLQARSWYVKSRDIWVKLESQGKLISENSGEPNRLEKEIENCTRVLARL